MIRCKGGGEELDQISRMGGWFSRILGNNWARQANARAQGRVPVEKGLRGACLKFGEGESLCQEI